MADIIVLEPPRTISLAAGTTTYVVQPETMAANVLPYRFVVPFIRILRSSDNNISSTGVQFDFFTAPLLVSPDDSDSLGTRFVPYSYNNTSQDGVMSITVSSFAPADVTTNGRTFYKGLDGTTSTLTAIQNPGGLILWRCKNLDGANAQRFRFEIHLVCRTS